MKIYRFLALLSALISGLIFGLGLILSGMANPEKVLGFLDLAGLWDPSLAFVMLGAIMIGLLAFTFAKKLESSFLKMPIHLPTSTKIDKRLVLGSLFFGIGWGLAGICPGPALVLLGTGGFKALVFVLFMLMGMLAFEILEIRRLSEHHSASTK